MYRSQFVNLIAKFLYIIYKNHTSRYSAMAVKIESTATKGDRERQMFLHIYILPFLNNEFSFVKRNFHGISK